MATASKLKRSKGAPPQREEVKADPIAENKRPEAKGHLQFALPIEMIEDFNRAAFEKFGMKHGAKTLLFKEMFATYMKS